MRLLERDQDVGPLWNTRDFLGGSGSLKVGFEVSKYKPGQSLPCTTYGMNVELSARSREVYILYCLCIVMLPAVIIMDYISKTVSEH